MIYLFKMAYRDLGRNRRRSFFSALALGLGLSLLLLMAAFVQGMLNQSMNSTVTLQSGHLQVRAATYVEEKTSLKWADLIENPMDLAAKIAALAPVKIATPRLYASGIVTSGDQSLGVRITGVDPASAANVPFRDGLVSGQFLTADDRDGVLVGQALADKIGLTTGGQISLMVNTSNGDTDSQMFTVRGIYTTHTSAIDERIVLMSLAKAQAFGKAENRASTIFVLLKNPDQVQAVVDAVQPTGLQVKTWRQLNELLVMVDDYVGAVMIVLYLVVLAVTATVVVNTLIMSVFERTREIGVLSAIGMKANSILSLFLAESAMLAVGGIVIGLVLGGILVVYFSINGFYFGALTKGINMLLSDIIYADLTLKDTIVLTITALVVTLLASLYPASLAAQMEPVDALRGGK